MALVWQWRVALKDSHGSGECTEDIFSLPEQKDQLILILEMDPL